MTDITTALETLRDYLNSKYLGHAEANRPHPNGCVWCALSEIETELTKDETDG